MVVKERTYRRRYIGFCIIYEGKISREDLVREIRKWEEEKYGITGYFDIIRLKGNLGILRAPHLLKEDAINMLKNIRRIKGKRVIIYPLKTSGTIKGLLRRLKEMGIDVEVLSK